MSESKAISGSILYTVEMGISTFLSLISIPIVTHQLSPSEYGTYALTVVYASIAIGIANLGMSVGYERNFFEYDGIADKSGALIYTAVVFVFLNITLLMIAVFFWREPLSEILLGKAVYGDLLVLVLLSTGLFSVASYYLTSLKNRGQSASYVKITIGKSVLNFFLVLLFLLHFEFGVESLAYALFCSSAVVFLIVAVQQLKNYQFACSKAMLIDMLRISLPLTPRIFFGFLGTHFDKIMLRMMASMGGVGIYSIGQKVSTLIFYFMTALDRVFIPELYRKLFAQKEQGEKLSLDYLTPYVYASVFAALMVALFSEQLFMLLLPESYLGAIDVITILAVYYSSMFFGKISGTQLIYAKKTHITTVLTLIGIVVNVALNIPLIMKWGIMGAAWATMVAGVIMNFLSFQVAQRYAPVQWAWKPVASIYGIFLLAALFTLVAHTGFLGLPYVLIFMFKLVVTAVYLFLGARIGILTTKNIHIVYGTLVGMVRGRALAN